MYAFRRQGFEPGAFYLLDRAYTDFTRLAKIARTGAFFVTGAKYNLRFPRFGSNPKTFGSGVNSVQVGQPTLPKAREAFSWPLRRVRNFDPDTGKKVVILAKIRGPRSSLPFRRTVGRSSG